MTASVEVSVASEADFESLVVIVNDAYQVETGDTGVAFKKVNRFVEPENEFLPDIRSGKVLKAELVDSEGKRKIVGCISYGMSQDNDGARRCHFGPFAVSPSAQGLGAGRALLDAVTTKAKEAGAVSLDIEVVNWRTDLMPLYVDKLKFEVIGEAPFPAPQRVTRPCNFILLRKKL